jgi:hypothetical protein
MLNAAFPAITIGAVTVADAKYPNVLNLWDMVFKEDVIDLSNPNIAVLAPAKPDVSTPRVAVKTPIFK